LSWKTWVVFLVQPSGTSAGFSQQDFLGKTDFAQQPAEGAAGAWQASSAVKRETVVFPTQ
jgi:hypothetical protein